MTRLQIRPRPLDFNRKLPIIRSVRDFEDDEASCSPMITNNISTASTRSSHNNRLASEVDIEVQTRKLISEIPTPQFVVVDTYERDYSRSFTQPTSYVRGRGVRAELGDFVEYDLDNEDEDWLQEFNNERKLISPEKLENLLFKLEVLDHKTRERGGVIIPLGLPVPVILPLDAAAEALSQNIRYSMFQSVYNYWRTKRERWQKPVLRRLQPPPPVNDTNPYNVFRPREKAHRLHTRRMQRRENNVQSFDKLRQVMRNLGQAKGLMETLIKREEKKRELMECEVSLQRFQLKYKHETQLIDDGSLPGYTSSKYASSDEEFVDSDEFATGDTYTAHASSRYGGITDPMLMAVSTGHTNRDFQRSYRVHGQFRKRDPHEPVLLFTKPVDPAKAAAAGIVCPGEVSSTRGAADGSASRFHGRMGRGGRIIFDRWNPFTQTPLHQSPPFSARV